MVSLDAHTTRSSLAWTAAVNTLKFMAMFWWNVVAGVWISGAGMLARCTTASTPWSTSVAWP